MKSGVKTEFTQNGNRSKNTLAPQDDYERGKRVALDRRGIDLAGHRNGGVTNRA